MYHDKMKININGFLFKSIILLMLINLILPGITGSWSNIVYSNAYTYVFNYSLITSICSYLAIFLLYILLALCIHSNQKKGKINLIVAFSIFIFFIWCMISVFEANLQEIFFSDISINLGLIPLFYLLGYDKAVFESAKKVIPYIIVLMVVLILWNKYFFYFSVWDFS